MHKKVSSLWRFCRADNFGGNETKRNVRTGTKRSRNCRRLRLSIVYGDDDDDEKYEKHTRTQSERHANESEKMPKNCHRLCFAHCRRRCDNLQSRADTMQWSRWLTFERAGDNLATGSSNAISARSCNLSLIFGQVFEVAIWARVQSPR